MGQDEKYAEFLRGKRVALIGPSAAYEGSGAGPQLDSYDVVVRLNWGGPVPEALHNDLGRRTDVLYKRLLHAAMPTPETVGEWVADGIRWIVTGDNSLITPNARYFAGICRQHIDWTITGTARAEIIKETSTSPLIGVMAIVHLLRQPIASLAVFNCDFYAGGYQAGYGGRDYRAARGRREGTIADTHKPDPQLQFLYQLSVRDKRLQFDADLSRMARRSLGNDLGARVIIPARWASSRFPGKALTEIDGRPMILHTLEAVASVAKDPIVATDDERISRVVEAAGFRAIMTGDELTGTDRVAAAALQLKPLDKADIFVNVQGDEPLTDPEALIALVQAKRAMPGSVINAMCRLDEDPKDPSVVKAAIAPNGRLLYASRAAIPATKTGSAVRWRQMGLYAFNRHDLERFRGAGARGEVEAAEDVEILRFLEMGLPVQMIEVNAGGPAVDLPEHVALVEAALAERRELVTAP